jgi:ArsR family transcriptional regulator, arsenate/arsenite/antimonite-responsive transcriptional repressor
MAAPKRKTATPLADRQIADLAGLFGQLADKNRLRILITLAEQGETHVSALCQIVGQSQPAVSHHLTLLRMAGLVASRRDGKFNYYYLDGDGFGDLLDEAFTAAGRNGRMDFNDFALTFARTGKRR